MKRNKLRLTLNFDTPQAKQSYCWRNFPLPNSQIYMASFRWYYASYLATQDERQLKMAQMYLRNAYRSALKETQ